MHRFKTTVAGLFLAGMVVALPEADAINWWGDLIPHAAEGYGDQIDQLYYFIYWVTGLTFFGVQGLLLYYCFKYREREGNEGIYRHGSHKLELIWTITPAIMLLVLGLVQRSAWMDIKTQFPAVKPLDGSKPPIRIQVLAVQFNWFFRYPGPDGAFNTYDDYVSTSLVIPSKRTMLVQMRSADVLHSFFLPYHRVKQDAVPGLTIPIWFHSSMTNYEYARKYNKPLIGPNPWTFELACAELCGQGHTNMRAEMTVLDEDSYNEWKEKNTAKPWTTVGLTKEELKAQFAREKKDRKKHWGWAWAKNAQTTKIEEFLRRDKTVKTKKKKGAKKKKGSNQ
jgi:cytochrome c oxidase subunit 2